MSDEFHRPTLTFPTSAYNATQVRLYGIAPKSPDANIVYPGKQIELVDTVGGLDVRISVTTGSVAEDAKIGKAISQRLNNGECSKHTDQENFKELIASKVDLGGNENMVAYASTISVKMKQLGNVSISATITRQQAVASNKIITCGIIVGYSYEGHTYDLPKPKIMIIPTLPEARIPQDDSGFDAKESEGYAVWLVDKLDECVEFELNQGFVEQLILDANLPGKRAPNMYAGRMMMGHRSGRLSE
jgi:hypothetical protein